MSRCSLYLQAREYYAGVREFPHQQPHVYTMREFPKIRGTFLVVRIIGFLVHWCSVSGPSLDGNYRECPEGFNVSAKDMKHRLQQAWSRFWHATQASQSVDPRL